MNKRGVLGILVVAALLPTAGSLAQPPFGTMDFEPNPIGARTVSTLTIELTNPDPATPASDLALVHDLPGGLTIASPSNASTTCTNAILTAPDGGSSVALSNGRIGASETCVLQVDVTGAAPGVYMNVSGDVTSSAGNGGTASADLTISSTLPIFEMAFVPGTVPLGGTSTITYSIENTLPTTLLQSLSFRDVLPQGMIVASPPNASSTCESGFGPPLTAQPGGTEVTFISNFLGGGASCTASVDVTATTAGSIGNTTDPLAFSDPVSRTTGKAAAVLEVTVNQLNLAGFFSGDPVAPGQTLELDFTISNLDRTGTASSIAFTNDLDSTLSGLVALGLPMSDVCGAGSTISGEGTITLSGGTLAPEQSCSFSISLSVPGNAAPGVYANESSEVTAQIDGRMATGSRAVDSFEVNEAPTLAMELVPDAVPAGQGATLEFTITNVSDSSQATDIAFTNNLSAFVAGVQPIGLPASDVCGSGSSLGLIFIDTDTIGVALSGGTLAPGGSCTFGVMLDLPLGTPPGTYVNVTEPITATVGGSAVTGKPAEAELAFLAAPSLRKSFSEARVAPGDEVTLQFELSYGENALDDATSITFEDDLEAMLSGLVATDLPKNDVCGAGSSLSGTSTLTLSGGTLAPNEQCAFDVTLAVPADAETDRYTNATSEPEALVSDEIVVGPLATAELEVTTVVLEKEFVEDPIFADDAITLRFTITNDSATDATADMTFTDDLDAVLRGLVSTEPNLLDVCGTGSQLQGTSSLFFVGGSLEPGTSCTFDVPVQVPTDAAAGSYVNATSDFRFFQGGSLRIISGGNATLTITEPLSFEKAFDADAIAPGDTVTLDFTITNAHTSQPAEELTFTDDLGAALQGLEALGLPMADVCGSGSMLAGTDVITLTGGEIGPDDSCGFSVELQVPDDVATGTTVSNVTSELTGTINGNPRSAPPARDELEVTLMTLSKAFEDAAEQGGSTMLTFVIENLNSDSPATGVSFTDDLDAVLGGLVASGTPIDDACGPGSVLDGTSVLTLRDGNIAAGDSCTFSVTVDVPATAATGEYENVTSALSSSLGVVGGSATAMLTVVPATMEDGGVDGGPDGGNGDGGGGGGCGCRTTTAGDVPVWLLALVLFALWRRRSR